MEPEETTVSNKEEIVKEEPQKENSLSFEPVAETMIMKMNLLIYLQKMV